MSKKPKVEHEPRVEKRPRVGTLPQTSKRPRALAPAITYTDKPAWRLKRLDIGGPWCWRKMGRVDFDRVLARLQELETMTWQEILVNARRENHPIPVEQLSSEAQRRLMDIKLDDVDDVISLRVTARERVFGVRFGSALRLLWWDPNHEVCPSTKKHT